MGWCCDYCGAPADPWSGVQGMRPICSNPSCYSRASRTPEPVTPAGIARREEGRRAMEAALVKRYGAVPVDD